MPSRTYLFALFVLTLNGCGTDCPDIACDDLVNVIFSSAQEGDYTVLYGGEEYSCVDGQPSDATLAACDAHGFLLKKSSIDLEVSAQGERWSGSTQAILEPIEVVDAEETKCVLPCFRAETVMMIEEPTP